MSDAELLARHANVMPRWLALYYEEPIEIVRGHGRRVVDSQGRSYLDFFGGILTTMTGHGIPEVVDAIKRQADRILHTSTLYLIRPMVELAERIAGLSRIPDAKVFFTNSGSEANDTALMLACAYRHSSQILALRNGYHGRSFATQAITGNRGWAATSLSPFRVSYVQGPYRFRSPFRGLDDADYIEACVDDLRSTIDSATAGNIAGMIAEPIQGVGGFCVPPDGFFGAMNKVLEEHGALFISDEVQTGWGRTGEHFWGYEAHGIVPDIITFAKGLGNGLAIGGLVARADVMDSLPANSISTFGGNPLSCAGALANLDYLLDNDLQSNALRVGTYLLERLRPVERLDLVAEVRGRGLMIGIEMVRADGYTPHAAAAAAVLERCRERGLLIGKGGLYGNCLRIAPPLTVTLEEAEEAANIIEGVLNDVVTLEHHRDDRAP